MIVGLVLRSRSASSEVGETVGAPVALNIAPWAKIDSVVRQTDQKAVDVGSAVTPCILSLAPGRYHVHASNPNFPGGLDFDMTVPEGGGPVNQTMPGFQPEQEINSILNQ